MTPISKLLAAAILIAISPTLAGGVSAQQETSNQATSTNAGEKPPQTFSKLELAQLRSPFTKKSVLMLNAITARSKKTIDAYDAQLPAIRRAILAPATNAAQRKQRVSALARLSALASQSDIELRDMKAAEHKVRTSGEFYNDTILSAMVAFVMDVRTEITDKRAELAKALPSN